MQGTAGRLSQFKAKARGNPFLTLLAANILPITVAAAIGIAWWRGKISFVPGSENVLPSLAVLGVSMGALIFLAWVAAPVVLAAMRRIRGAMEHASDSIARGGLAGLVLKLPMLLAAALAYVVLWLNAVLIVLLVASGVLAVLASFVAFAAEVWRVRAG